MRVTGFWLMGLCVLPLGVARGDDTTGQRRLRPELLNVADPPPRDAFSYTDYQGSADYDVTIKIGEGPGAETYQGSLHYSLNRSRRWHVTGTLNEKGSRSVGAFMPNRFLVRPGSEPASNFDYLEQIPSVSGEFSVDQWGSVTNENRQKQINMFLGNFLTLPILPLPKAGETQWSAKDATMVVTENRDPMRLGLPRIPRFSPPGFDPLGRDRQLAAAAEKSDYKVEGTDGSEVTVTHRYDLDASKLKSGQRLKGQGTSIFDRERGLFIKHDFQRTFSVNRGGGLTTVPIRLMITLKSDFGLKPLTERQKKDIAEAKAYAASPEGIAEAKRIEKEKMAQQAKYEAERNQRARQRQSEYDKVFEPAQRKALIDAISSAKDYQDGAQYSSKLRNASSREDKELARTVYQYANRISNASLAGTWYDLAAKFDPDFAKVKEVRKKLRFSFQQIDAPGPAVESTSQLATGQLVLFSPKYSRGMRPHEVALIKDNQVVLKKIDQDRTIDEIVELSDLRLPPIQVRPYLLPRELGKSESAITAPSATNTKQSSETMVWIDKSGKHRVEADFVSLEANVLRLRRTDGKEVEVPLSMLNETSAAKAKELAIATENPFKLVEP